MQPEYKLEAHEDNGEKGYYLSYTPEFKFFDYDEDVKDVLKEHTDESLGRDKDSIPEEVKQKDNRRRHKFEGVAYSGLPIMSHPLWGNLIFDTSSVTSKVDVPMFINHDTDRPAGHSTLTLSDGAIKTEGFLYEEFGEFATSLMKNGFPMEQSVYIIPGKTPRQIAEGQKEVINGHEVEGPMTVFEENLIREVSLTPLGADMNTSTTTFKHKGDDMKPAEVKKVEPKSPEKSEDMAEDFNEEHYNQFVDALGKGLKEAYLFSCCDACAKGGKKKKKKEDSEFSDKEKKMQKELEKLQEENKALKEKIAESKKNKRFAEITEKYAQFNLKPTEGITNILLAAEDEQFSALLEEITVGLTAQVKAPKKELFAAEKTSEESKATPGKSLEDKIDLLSNKFMAENSSLSMIEAVRMAKDELKA